MQALRRAPRRVQRIMSKGDHAAAPDPVVMGSVLVDQAPHTEVLARCARLNLAPCAGFVAPAYIAVLEAGKMVDARVSNDEGYVGQMLRCGKNIRSRARRG